MKVVSIFKGLSKPTSKALGVGLVGAVVLSFGFYTFQHFRKAESNFDPGPIISEIQKASELTTAKAPSKVTIVKKQDKKLWGLSVGETNLVYEAAANVRTSLDLEKIQVLEANRNTKRVHVLLPPPYISEVALDLNNSHTIASYRSWFGDKFSPELHDQAQKDAIDKIKKEACSNRILDAANDNARELIQGILTRLEFQSIQIDTQPARPDCSQL